VSWAHGTTGLADECAPSKVATAATALPWEQDLLDRGYVLAATDYEGLGTPGPHPYLVGESEGRGVLDAARAAHRLGGTRNLAGAGTRVVVMGHSQGGQAALFAGQIAAHYSPDLRVRGVAALAPETDPEWLFAAAGVPSVRAFAAMAIEGVRAAFAKTDVDAVLTPAAASVMRSLAVSGCVTETFLALTNVNLLRADAHTVPSMRRALMRSAAGHVASRIPILVLQGDRDATVPELATRAYVARACLLGDALVYERFPEATHGSIVAAGTPVLLQWLDDRINGTGTGNANGNGNSKAPARSC
jgi:pimeloyl-ACP methyl ester carboxylesterase